MDNTNLVELRKHRDRRLKDCDLARLREIARNFDEEEREAILEVFPVEEIIAYINKVADNKEGVAYNE